MPAEMINRLKNKLSGAYPCMLAGVTVLLLAGAVPVKAQDLEKDMQQFYRGFMSQPTLECEMEVKAIDKADNSVFLQKKIHLILDNNSYYYDLGDVICLSNKKYVVMVDNQNKRIVVGRNEIGEVDALKKKMILQNDSIIFKSRGQVVYDGISGDRKSYRVLHPEPFIKQVNVDFNSSTGHLRKVEIIFNEEADTGISSSGTEITKINTKPVITERTFDESKYIISDKGQIKLTPAYKNYHLIVADPTILYNLNANNK